MNKTSDNLVLSINLCLKSVAFRFVHVSDDEANFRKLLWKAAPFLRQFPNVEMRRVTLQSVVKDTPLTKLLPALNKSRFAPVHKADLARLALMSKYGGLYSDSDVIAIRDFTNLGDFVIRTSVKSQTLNFAVMKFSKKRQIFSDMMENVAKHFNPELYFSVMIRFRMKVKSHCRNHCNQPLLLSRRNTQDLKCCDFKVLGSSFCLCFWRSRVDEFDVILT